jgi:hypothetical protein
MIFVNRGLEELVILLDILQVLIPLKVKAIEILLYLGEIDLQLIFFRMA